jgi:HTH-type transcriptional regulator/antitoxin MqsA
MKLGLTQEQLAGIVGGGLKSLARYESGQVCQSKGMDNLLRILDAYPETLNIIHRKKEVAKNVGQVIYLENSRKKSVYRLDQKTFSVETGEAACGS